MKKKSWSYRLIQAVMGYLLLVVITTIIPACQNQQIQPTLTAQVQPKVTEEKQPVLLDKHIDGDTTRFSLNGKSIKIRYLAIDTQETVHPTKEATMLGHSASDYVKEKLELAKKIELEFAPESDKEDKYGRVLAWVWVDDVLLQEELVQKGLAEVKYIYGDYKYLDKLEAAQQEAKNNKLGIWSEVANE